MPSRRDAVAPTVDRILAAVSDAGLSRDQSENFAVALSEALSNAAVHGNKLSPKTRVRVLVAIDPGQCVTVEVADSGPGFDCTCVEDPTDPDHLLDARGRGVYLMRRLVDRVEYNGSGNQVRLVVEAVPQDDPSPA